MISVSILLLQLQNIIANNENSNSKNVVLRLEIFKVKVSLPVSLFAENNTTYR